MIREIAELRSELGPLTTAPWPARTCSPAKWGWEFGPQHAFAWFHAGHGTADHGSETRPRWWTPRSCAACVRPVRPPAGPFRQDDVPRLSAPLVGPPGRELRVIPWGARSISSSWRG